MLMKVCQHLCQMHNARMHARARTRAHTHTHTHTHTQMAQSKLLGIRNEEVRRSIVDLLALVANYPRENKGVSSVSQHQCSARVHANFYAVLCALGTPDKIPHAE